MRHNNNNNNTNINNTIIEAEQVKWRGHSPSRILLMTEVLPLKNLPRKHTLIGNGGNSGGGGGG